jgi:hypothetical protein
VPDKFGDTEPKALLTETDVLLVKENASNLYKILKVTAATAPL